MIGGIKLIVRNGQKHWKRGLFITVLLIMGLLPGSPITPGIQATSNDQVAVTVSDASGAVGGFVEVAVIFSDVAEVPGVTGISGGELVLVYDADVVAVLQESDITWGAMISEPGSWYYDSNRQYTANSIKVSWASSEEHLDGTLLTVRFKLLTAGTIDVTVGSLLLKNQDVADIPPDSITKVKGTVSSKFVNRIFGDNRYLTAAEISRQGWPGGAATVLVAQGDNFPDSVAGVSLAYQLNAPLLLTPTNRLHQVTEMEIERLGANRVIILGGTNAVSDTVKAALLALDSVVEVDRLAGTNRYDTAKLIAGELHEGAPFDTAFLVFGLDFPDALAAASYGAMKGWPILLTGRDRLPQATLDALESLSSIENIVIVGGEAVIGSAVEVELTDLGFNVERIMGDNRYLTAVELAKKYLSEEAEEIFITTGLNFPDALAGGVLAAKRNSGVLLVRGDRAIILEQVEDFIQGQNITGANILGGTFAVSQAIENQLFSLLE